MTLPLPPPPPGAKPYEMGVPKPPVLPSDPRRYDLDALRGFAMLLGVALHAAIPFVPYWAEGDAGSGFLFGFFEFIHGFRMPMFFILSGYFTTMLWRRRGLAELLKHRLRRIGLPLLVGMFTVMPLIIAGIIGGYVISGEGFDEVDVAGVYDEDIDDPGSKAGATAKQGTDEVKETDGADDGDLGFAHMWFLWFLLWMVAGFAPVAALIGWLARKRRRERVVPARLVTVILLALPILAVPSADAMVERVFGPDTSESFIPSGAPLAYYACFFAFGALAFDRHTHGNTPLIDAVGRWWPAQLAFGSLVLFPLGKSLMDNQWTVSAIMQVAFAWTMSFGLLGAFRQFMSAKSFAVRWLSDASYWMYLMHLPLVFVAQGIVTRLEVPAIVGFGLICAAVTPPLLVSYRFWVRYSFIGNLLNGARSRAADDAERAALSGSATA